MLKRIVIGLTVALGIYLLLLPLVLLLLERIFGIGIIYHGHYLRH